MNPREQRLALAVGSLGVLTLGFYAWTTVDEMFIERQEQIQTLESRKQDQIDTSRRAARAAKTMTELAQRSLPADRVKARSMYEQWLLTLIEKHQFAQPSVRPIEPPIRNETYEQHRFQIEGAATLPQVAEFLSAFYQSNELHRMSQLTLTPQKNSRELEVSCIVEALALTTSKRNAIGDQVSPQYTAEQLADARKSIIERGMFFPPNMPPAIESISSQRIERGSTMRVTAKVKDPDAWDKLEIKLGSEAPKEVEIEAKGREEAEIRWTPKENGTYTVPVEVHDAGHPPRVAQTTIQVTVVDPAPPVVEKKPSFDHLQHTFLVGTLDASNRRQAWFNVRTTGELIKVFEGEMLTVGDFKAKITAVGTDDVDLVAEINQKSLKLRIGQNLQGAASTDGAKPEEAKPDGAEKQADARPAATAETTATAKEG